MDNNCIWLDQYENLLIDENFKDSIKDNIQYEIIMRKLQILKDIENLKYYENGDLSFNEFYKNFLINYTDYYTEIVPEIKTKLGIEKIKNDYINFIVYKKSDLILENKTKYKIIKGFKI